MAPAVPFLDDDGKSSESEVGTDWTVPGVEPDDEGRWIIDTTLASRQTDNGTSYLIKWQGFPTEEATWEPENELPQDTIDSWKEKTRRIQKGYEEPFDVDSWVRDSAIFAQITWSRRRRRIEKRLRSDLPANIPEYVPPEDKARLLEVVRKFKPESSKRAGIGKSDTARKSTDVKAEPASSDDEPLFERQKSVSVSLRVNDANSDVAATNTNRSPRRRHRPVADDSSASESSSVAVPLSATTSKRQTHVQTDVEQNKQQSKPEPNTRETQNVLVQQKQYGTNASKAKKSATKHAAGPKRSSITESGDASKTPWKELPLASSTSKPTVNTAIPGNRPALPKRARTDGPEYFTTLNHRHYHNKKQQQDRHVPADKLVLRTLEEVATGRKAPVQSPDTQITPVAPIATMMPQSSATQSAGTIPLACPYYSKGTACSHGNVPCPFLHEEHEDIAPFKLYTQWQEYRDKRNTFPKFEVPAQYCPHMPNCFKDMTECWYAHWSLGSVEITCPYWASGACRKSEKDCMYAHRHTGRVAPLPSAELQRRQSYHGSVNEVRSPGAVAPARARNPQKRDVICRFWAKGSCYKSAEDCDFMHEDRGSTNPITGLSNTSTSADAGPILSSLDISSMPPSAPVAMRSSVPGQGGTPTTSVFGKDSALISATAQRTNLDTSYIQSKQADFPALLQLSLENASTALVIPVRVTLVDVHGRDCFTTEGTKHVNKQALLPLKIEGMVSVQPLASIVHSSPNILELVTHGALKATGVSAELDQIANLLAHRGCAANLQSNDRYWILAHPCQQTEWDFLQIPKLHDDSSALRIIVFRSLSTGATQRVTSANPSTDGSLSAYVKDVFGMTRASFCSWTSADVNLKRIFLMFPLERKRESTFWCRYFQEVGCEVYLLEQEGAWEKFIGDHQSGGVVLLHPDIQQFASIPGLASLLIGRYNFFHMGVDPWQSDATSNDFQITPIFKHGTTTLLTDQFMETRPKEALLIIDHILSTNQRSTEDQRTWRLYARPDLIDWLFTLLDKKYKHEWENKDPTRRDLYVTARNLLQLPTSAESVGPPLLISESAADFPHYAALADSSPEQATEALIGRFALWACQNRHFSRRFVVVRADTEESKGWAEQWRHLLYFSGQKWLKMFAPRVLDK